jgi:hypothetical protein
MPSTIEQLGTGILRVGHSHRHSGSSTFGKRAAEPAGNLGSVVIDIVNRGVAARPRAM